MVQGNYIGLNAFGSAVLPNNDGIKYGSNTSNEQYRALTAVALLFAMLEVRPVPFCVLDEVDAALDEANVGRFSEALRGLADRTQFIVITHNRGTIEAADALYGVTVGDDSVSRVISLRLDEARAIADRQRGPSLDHANGSANGHDGRDDPRRRRHRRARRGRLMFWRRKREEPAGEPEPTPEIDLDAPEPDPADFESGRSAIGTGRTRRARARRPERRQPVPADPRRRRRRAGAGRARGR